MQLYITSPRPELMVPRGTVTSGLESVIAGLL